MTGISAACIVWWIWVEVPSGVIRRKSNGHCFFMNRQVLSAKTKENMLPKHAIHAAEGFSYWHHKLRTCIFVTCGTRGIVQQSRPISFGFYREDNTKPLAFIFVCWKVSRYVWKEWVVGFVSYMLSYYWKTRCSCRWYVYITKAKK